MSVEPHSLNISPCSFVYMAENDPTGGWLFIFSIILGKMSKLILILLLLRINRWWVGGWVDWGVKIKSKENESPFPQSRSGYKYIHIDTHTHIWFSTRGWHYISWSVGGVMRGMYNSSMWDSTEGWLLYPSEPLEHIANVLGWICCGPTRASDSSVKSSQSQWRVWTDRRPRGFTPQRREVIEYDRKWGGRSDCHSGGAEAETPGCAENISQELKEDRESLHFKYTRVCSI